jgi:hypothetical protein
VAFGLDDDCKTTLEAGGCFGAFTLAELPGRLGLPEDGALFPPEASDPSGRLASGGRARGAARFTEAQQLLRGVPPSRAWAASPRIALADLVRLARRRQPRSESPIEPASIASLLKAGAQPDLRRLAASLRTPVRARRAARDLDALIRGDSPPLAQARAIRLRSMLDGHDRGDAALAAVRRGVERAQGLPSQPARVAVDLGRTRRCHLAGPHRPRRRLVRHAAHLPRTWRHRRQHGHPPRRATPIRRHRSAASIVRWSACRSIDLAREAEWSQAAPSGDFADPTDWSALAKACAGAVGAGSLRFPSGSTGLASAAGGHGSPRGIEVALEAAVPKGSGLGTSSILAATLLAALDALQGRA